MRQTLAILASAAVALASGAAAQGAGDTVDVDPEAYEGLWYEIARTPAPFQAQCEGGVTATLVDAAAGVAIIGHLGGRPATTVDLTVSYLRPVTQGKVHARSRIVKMGKTLAFATVEVKDSHGRLIATGSATYMLLES